MAHNNTPPVIGLTTYGRKETGKFYLPDKYVDAVRKAGGIPVLLPPGEINPARILEIIDGLIFTGGGDIDPTVYGGAMHPTIARIDPERDAFELALAQKALGGKIPVLGICRGLQLLTVATGGDLVAHVPDEFGNKILHRGGESEENRQAVEHLVWIKPHSRLAQITGVNELPVASMHHQAARTIPPGWQVTAQSEDGVIEALEHQSHPWMIAVLWHPELSLEDERQQGLFRALVEAAGRR